MSSATRLLTFAGLAIPCVLLVGLSFSEAADKKKAPNPAKVIAKQQMNFAEAEALRVAYILVNAANHNYDGHRVKALKNLEDAINRLDSKVMNNGTLAQQAASIQQDVVANVQRQIAKNSPKAQLNQALSNALMLRAGQIIAQVAPTIKKRNQDFVFNNVKDAQEQIEKALKSQ